MSRFETQSNGDVHVFHREIGFYSDVKTGKYVDWWHNPLIDDKVEVYHIKNDHVNNKMAAINEMDFDGHMIKLPFPAKWDILGATTVNNFELLIKKELIIHKIYYNKPKPNLAKKALKMLANRGR